MRQVLYFVYQPIHTRPPCLAQVCMLRDMGISVAVLTTGCDENAGKLLAEKGIPCRIFHQKRLPALAVQRAVNAVNYGAAFGAFYRRYWSDDAVLWVGSEESLLKMWRYLRRRRPLVVNALEFSEGACYQAGMKKLAPQVEILTACEPNRADYMKSWWELERTPYVLRNKPYGAFPPKGEGSTPELRAAIRRLRGRKVLLYQGAIEKDRDLCQLAQALSQAGSDYLLALSGPDKDGGVARLEAIYSQVCYLGNFPAPTHLEVTPYATAAVAFYRDNCINNRYCAPNKIYEYAGSGVPMLCNRVPGLTETVGAAGAAECVDFSDAAAVLAALKRIEEHYDGYRRAALAFFDATDNAPVMAALVEDAFSRTKAERK